MNASLNLNRDATAVHPAAFDWSSVVHEMLSNLDNVSVAGQHHVMDKIIRFVEAEASPALRHMRARNRLAFTELVAGLRHESARPCPDVASFTRGGEAVSALLATMAETGS